MATANFHARLERIEKAQAQSAPQARRVGFRPARAAGVSALRRGPARKRHPVMEHILSIALGVMLGAFLTVGFIGLSHAHAPWGPGTPWNEIAYYPIMAGFGLAPLLLLVSLMVASKRPGFALFSLGYISGIVVPLIL